MEISARKPSPNLPSVSPLRIGLLVDDFSVSQYVYDFAQWAQSQPNIVVADVILYAGPKSRSEDRSGFWSRTIRSMKNNGLSSALADWAFLLVNKFERAVIKRNKRHAEHLVEFDLSSLVASKIIINPIKSDPTFGQVCQFDEADIRCVKQLDLDLIVQCGNCTPAGDILNASRLGIISIQYGDAQKSRGGPAGFWEVYRREEMTGFTIKLLSGDFGGRDVLLEGRFATKHYYMLNQAFIYRKAHFYLKHIIEKIVSTGNLPERTSSFPYSRQISKNPTLFEVAAYFLMYCYDFLAKKIRGLLNIHYRWSVAYIPQDYRDAVLCRGIKLKNRPYHYLADPFVITRNGKNYCFAEDFDHLRQRGAIDVYELAETRGIRIGTALNENFHLSFPYLFEHQNELYMCPESSENKDIRVYKCVDFPLRWKLEKVIMSEISAADTMIFQRGEKWWMLTNVDLADVGDYRSELCIFYADSPLEERWTPHPLNPVIIDASRARNAGCFITDDTYIRFSQSQGFDVYGKRVLINRIVELSDTKYVESCAAVVAPSFFSGIVGTHHLHSNGQLTVFDFSMNSRISNEGQ